MPRGRIKKLTDKGFGFIAADQGAGDIFFHLSVLEEASFETLQEGQAVEYEAEQDTRGPRATVVRLADDA